MRHYNGNGKKRKVYTLTDAGLSQAGRQLLNDIACTPRTLNLLAELSDLGPILLTEPPPPTAWEMAARCRQHFAWLAHEDLPFVQAIDDRLAGGYEPTANETARLARVFERLQRRLNRGACG